MTDLDKEAIAPVKKRDVPVIALRFLLRPKAQALGRATPKGIAFFLLEEMTALRREGI